MRLFVAIPIEEPARGAIAALIERLRQGGESVKWVARENLHLTVKFFGEVPESRVREIEEALARATQGAQAFELKVRGLGAFPSRGRPRVVWAGLEAPPVLAELIERVERETEPLGFPRERRDPSPHVTIGRAREAHQRRRPRPGRAPDLGGGPFLAEAIAREGHFDGGAVAADRLILMRSDLRPAGPIYTPVREFPLAGGRPG